MTDYEPNAGDLIWTDFDPGMGREQGGRRPAVIVSPIEFWRTYGSVIVCPIASRIRPFPTSVVLPLDRHPTGEALTHHLRSIDTEARPIKFTGERISADLLHEVRAKIAAIIGLDAW